MGISAEWCPFWPPAALEELPRGATELVGPLRYPAGSGRDPGREPRIRSRAVRFFWSASGRVWRYFWVVVIWAWPIRSITLLRSDPPASSQEAWAWRRSWTRTSKSTPDAATADRQTRVRKVFLERGVPSRVANSRSPERSRRSVIQSASWPTRSEGRPRVWGSLSLG